MRGVALAVLPVMVGGYALSGLTAPSGLAVRSKPTSVARVGRDSVRVSDRVRAPAGLQVVNGLPLTLPPLPGTPQLTVPGTISELAAAAGLDAGTIRWANDLQENQEAAVGQVLLVPPTRGSLLWHPSGETTAQFADRTGIPLATLTAYNSHPEAGARKYLQVPFGTLGAPLAASEVVVAAPGVPAVSTAQRNHGANGFPFGQCTWFAASKRDVRWSGNAGQWLRAARGIRPEGKVPVVRALAVQTGGPGVSSVGHVSYVESLNDDGSFQVAEMNYRGLGVIDHRTLRVGRDGVAGFIY
ncbi:MAG: CHAP domain-containing protein [Candidatus Dormibacteria bacterium]